MRSVPFTPGGDRIRWIDTPGAADGPARVFVHGLGGSGGHTFGHVAGDPACSGRRTLVLDLPGHAHSDRPREYGYTLEDHAAALEAVLDHEGLRAVDLVGHSMGGSISILLASRRPDLVGRLVVAEPNLDRAEPSDTGLGSQWIANRTEDAFATEGWTRLAADDPDWGITLRICDPIAVHRSAVGLIAGTDPPLRDLLRDLPIPRTYVAGSDGEGIERAARLPDAGVRVVVVPNAGHSMMVDQPAIFAAELRQALAQVV
jgi:pimeloyl-ACP methyl ester carboxylesterase